MTTDQFRNRPLEVRVLERCNECETLKDDVKEHSNCWVTAVCCGPCFTQLVAEAQGLILC